MRILICGDRNYTSLYEELIERELSSFPISETTILHGACSGVDTLAGKIATKLGYTVESYPANWKKYGKAAGPIRNRQMVDSGVDIVLAFHSSFATSRGTKDCVEYAQSKGIPVKIFG